MFAVDIASFSRREPDVQLYLRAALYRIVQDSCGATGVPFDDCHHEDRGDGILMIAHADADVEALLDPLVTQIRTELRKHNKVASAAAQIRLRMAVHAGYLHLDAHGASGANVIHLFRLLDAPALKTEFATHGGDFALIVSDYLYQEIVVYGPGLIEPAAFHPITVTVKETNGRGWTWIPSPSGRPNQQHAGQHAPSATAATHHQLELTSYNQQIALLTALGCIQQHLAEVQSVGPHGVQPRICPALAELLLTTRIAALHRKPGQHRRRPDHPRLSNNDEPHPKRSGLPQRRST
jgi:hypothetical protein